MVLQIYLFGLGYQDLNGKKIDLKKFPKILEWYKKIANREAVIKGYDVPKTGADIPLP